MFCSVQYTRNRFHRMNKTICQLERVHLKCGPNTVEVSDNCHHLQIGLADYSVGYRLDHLFDAVAVSFHGFYCHFQFDLQAMPMFFFLISLKLFLFIFKFFVQHVEIQIWSHELLGKKLNEKQFTRLLRTPLHKNIILLKILFFSFNQRSGDTIKWIPMDGTASIFRSFLLWRVADQWSLCVDGCTLLKNVRILNNLYYTFVCFFNFKIWLIISFPTC